jgi:hypothetical protein
LVSSAAFEFEVPKRTCGNIDGNFKFAALASFYFVIDSSAGAPVSVRFGEQVMIMIASVRM